MDCILPEYRPSDEEYKNLWENCIFVLDTSVIFNIYRYSPELRNQIKDILKKILPRLWFPYQVAYEYYDNLPTVKGKEIGKYEAIRRFISDIQKSIQAEIDKDRQIDKDLKRKHSSSLEILNEIDPIIKEYKSKFKKQSKHIEINLEDIIKKYPNREDLNRIDEFIISLFSDKVGEPYSIEMLEEISDKGSKRYNLLLPPGYMDAKEKDGIKKYGDLIIWFQIIDRAKEKKTPIIFICDDLKEDWWWSPSNTTLGPRPELIQEFVSETKTLFWMYSLDQFMKYAQKYISLTVKKELIEEAKDYRIDEEQILKYTEHYNSVIQSFIQSSYPSLVADNVLAAVKASSFDPAMIQSIAQASFASQNVRDMLAAQPSFTDLKELGRRIESTPKEIKEEVKMNIKAKGECLPDSDNEKKIT